MALCVNQSGTWRNITSKCINDSGTWRKACIGHVNQSGTWRRYLFVTPPIGTCICGGNLASVTGGCYWIAAPTTSEVSRSWYSRNDAITRAQQVSGVSGWFIPSASDLLSRPSGWSHGNGHHGDGGTGMYWSDTQVAGHTAQYVLFGDGCIFIRGKQSVIRVRAFRTVAY